MLKVSSSRDAIIGRTKSLISSLEASFLSSVFASSFFSPLCSVVLPPSAGFSSVVVPPPPQPLNTRDAVIARASNLDTVLFILFTSSLDLNQSVRYIATSVPFAGQNLLPMQICEKIQPPHFPSPIRKKAAFLERRYGWFIKTDHLFSNDFCF